MKRKKLTWLFCLFFAAFFFLVPAVAHASAKDDIGKYDVTVNILKNGDAKVTHEITYNLSKKAHQLTLPQSISGIDDVYAVSVSVVSGSKKIRLKQGTSHKKNTFETKQTNKNSEITTYRSAKIHVRIQAARFRHELQRLCRSQLARDQQQFDSSAAKRRHSLCFAAKKRQIFAHLESRKS